MPINNCSSDGKPGFKWGDSGSCYTYTSGDEKSIAAAKKKVLAQATAIGEFDKSSEDISDDSEMGKSEEMINGYPAATQDIEVNLAYRQEAIDKAAYGPMNPALENAEFWQRKADLFHTSIEEAKTARCKNCAAFIQTSYMKEAIAQGLGGEDIAYAVINLANLGYCEIFDFKCAGQRTCDAWVTGGPVTDGNANINKSLVYIRKIQYRDPLN
jgi:hypothetical protein